MSRIHSKLPYKPDDPVPKVVDSMEGTVMWGVRSAAPEGECNIDSTCSVENTTYVWNAKLRLKCKMNTFNENFKKMERRIFMERRFKKKKKNSKNSKCLLRQISSLSTEKLN